MSMLTPMVEELTQEAIATRKMLERVPEDQLGWKPHEKSMTLGRLASHIAENPGWALPILQQEELNIDMASYQPLNLTTVAEMLETFDKNNAAAVAAMGEGDDASLLATWRMLVNGQPAFEQPRIGVIRGMVLNHGIHHRGQLSVYLRLLNVPLPSVYGPSADEGHM
jgi:uncharacterized damage-inducible protein DinB